MGIKICLGCCLQNGTQVFNSLWWVQYISGTIMFDDTLLQSSRAGVPFVDIVKEQGILPGIKVDTGLQPIDGTAGETSTQGLDGLAERCKRSVYFLPPAQNLCRTITQVVSDLSTHKEKLYCIFFFQVTKYFFSTRGVCLISPGSLVHTTICTSLPTTYGDQYSVETQDTHTLTGTIYCCKWPMVELVATTWAIAACVNYFNIFHFSF